jgi:hypothetical protein
MFLVAMFVSAAGCKDERTPSQEGPAKAAEGARPSGAKADKPAAGPVEIPALGLVLDGPAGAEVSEMLGDQMVQAPGLVLTVGVVEGERTLEAAVDDADLYSPTFTRKDALGDGYHLEFNNTGAMGANYFVEVVRSIGGKTYKCTTTAMDRSIADAVAAACLSLRAK